MRYSSKPSSSAKDGQARRHHYSPFQVYLAQHTWVALSTLGQLWRAPLATLLTSAVIAIALALPMALYVLLLSTQALTQHWESSNQISVYLHLNTPEQSALQLQKTIANWSEIKRVNYISPQDALKEFTQISGFGDAAKSLTDNPLPAVLSVLPLATLTQTKSLEALVQRLQQLPQVELVQLDMGWLKKLQAMLALAKRALLFLSVILGVAILLIIGNTLRLSINNRQREIIVCKLIGGTGRFIRRPFLYLGFWYGLTGAILAWLILQAMLLLLASPVYDIALLYASDFRLVDLGLNNSLILFGISILLSITGSWLATFRHLQKIEPR